MACRLRAEQWAWSLRIERRAEVMESVDWRSAVMKPVDFRTSPRWSMRTRTACPPYRPPSSPWQVSRCVFGSVFGRRCFFYFTRSFSSPPCFHTLVVGRKKGGTMLCVTLSTNHAEPLEFQAFTLKPSILLMKTFLVQFFWQAFFVKSKWWAVSLFEGGYNPGAQIRSNIIQWHVWNHQVVLPKMGRIT